MKTLCYLILYAAFISIMLAIWSPSYNKEFFLTFLVFSVSFVITVIIMAMESPIVDDEKSKNKKL
jgi:hypothetical protein